MCVSRQGVKCLICKSVCRTARKEFINAKYIDHKFARRTISTASSGLDEVYEAVQSRDLLSIIQLYAEGVELLQLLPDPGKVGWTVDLSTRTSGPSVREEISVCLSLVGLPLGRFKGNSRPTLGGSRSPVGGDGVFSVVPKLLRTF